jgi:hypothetical protein
MIFGNDRNQLRKAYADAWQKFQQGLPMQPLEQQIAAVIKEHSEYHHLLNDLDSDFSPDMGETNPFLHMGMHLALREQLSTQRPAGINACFQALATKLGSQHDAEHEMMECLGEALWLAQRQGTMPDELAYLECLRSRAGLQK